ncbi:MAG TPA: ATP synthase F1 subunit delta [Vicinamibacterales bacterium]|jgi:F-type H+-transporting ATPase subunit delta
MTNRSSAARYARALLDVSRVEADPKAVEAELASFVAIVESNDQLRRAVVNPAIPAQRKAALVTDLLDHLTVSPVVRKLIVMLANRDRLVLLSDMLDEYRRRLLDFLNVVQAEITSAVPLPADRVQALQQAIAEKTGRDVIVTTKVDRAIIGGVVTRIGSVVYDGSVQRQLEKMKDTLTQSA